MRYDYTDRQPAYDDCAAAIQARSDRADQDARERHAADQRAEQNGRDDLPAFHHTPAAQRAPIIPAPPAEPTETRMSIAQLRDRISGMEATTRAKDEVWQQHAAGQRACKPERPSERIERAEKLTRYRAELARRTASDEAEKAERARLDTAAAAVVATAAAELASPQRVDPADVPALVQCQECGLMVAQDTAGDMIDHLDTQQTRCTAKPTEWDRPHNSKGRPWTNAQLATFTTTAAPAPKRETASQAAERVHTNAQRAATAAARAAEHAVELEARRNETPAAVEAALQIQRDAIAADAAHAERAREIPPVPPAAAAATAAASTRRRAVVATAREDTLSTLDCTVEALVAEHGCGSVIDAAWAASARIFRPQGVRV